MAKRKNRGGGSSIAATSIKDVGEEMVAPHALPAEKICSHLRSSPKGITSAEGERRLAEYGPNELPEGARPNQFLLFLRQFSSPLVWLLLGAMAISFFLHETFDTTVIAVIIALNAVIGFSQEYQADEALRALRKLSTPKARVLRDGQEVLLESRSLVPGDIVLLESGDKVPTDARLLEAIDLAVQEATLTGGSQATRKSTTALPEKTVLANRANMVYSSTMVTRGHGKAIVTATGMRTEVGRIAALLQDTPDEKTPLQKNLEQLGKGLTLLTAFIVATVFFLGIFTGKEPGVMLLAATALAVAAVPEGLPALITISLALGVKRIAQKNALMRRLPSIETLGCINIICTGKTGTLTYNEMTVTKLWANDTVYEVAGSGYQPKGEILTNGHKVDAALLLPLLKTGFLCNNTSFRANQEANQGKTELIGDPTEAALLTSAAKGGIRDQLRAQEPRLGEIHFSSERKMMTTIHRTKAGRISYTKGAPDILLPRCDRILINGKVQKLDETKKKKILRQNDLFAQQALRVLGCAYKLNGDEKNAERGMIFVGLQAMLDPPREEVKEALKKCREAGIRVVMITGDQLSTAKAVARELGIEGEAITGEELQKISLEKKISTISIFARVNSEDKLKIVAALQKKGHVVAMTGDGANDAPALKKADIGISSGVTGTEAAKEASDMILLDDNFVSIVNTVEEGRGIFDNIRKFVNYLLSSNLAEVLIIFFATLFRFPLPLTAVQLLLVNLVTDVFPSTAMGVDPYEKGIMQRKPRKPEEPILSRGLVLNLVLSGVLVAAVILALFGLYLHYSSIEKAQTVVFTALVIFEMIQLQIIRSQYGLSLLSNKMLVLAMSLTLGLQLVVLYTPLQFLFKVTPLAYTDWLILGVGALAIIGLHGVFKRLKLVQRFEEK